MITKLAKSLALVLTSSAASSALLAAPLLQLGNGMSLHALATTELVYEDNVFLDPFTKENDLILTVTPGLELKLAREGAASLSIKYEHIFHYYDEYNDLDRDLARFSLGFRYDSGVLLATANASFAQHSSSSAISGVIAGSLRGNPVDRDVTTVGGSLRYGVSRLISIGAGATYTETDYKINTYTDTESISVPVTLFYQIRPKVNLTAGVRYREVDAKSVNARQDYEDIFYSVGLVGELFSPVLLADVQVGLQDRKYKNAGVSIDTPTYAVSLIYVGDPKATISATLRRDYRVSSLDAGTYATSMATLAAQYALNTQVSLSGSLNFAKNDYQLSDRKEDVFIFTLGGTYRANDYISLHAGYEYHDIDGNKVFNSYKLNKFKVSASLRY